MRLLNMGIIFQNQLISFGVFESLSQLDGSEACIIFAGGKKIVVICCTAFKTGSSGFDLVLFTLQGLSYVFLISFLINNLLIWTDK